MIKLKNSEASALVSPDAKKIYGKEFPTKTTFILLDIVQSIESRISKYHELCRDIIKKHGGEITPDGLILYAENGKREKAIKELNELGSTELEYPGEKIKMTVDWPKLTIAEAAILKPLIE